MPYKIIGLTDRRTGQKLYTLHNSVAWGIIKELVLDQFFFVCKLCLEVDFLLYRFVWIGFHWYHCIYTFIFLIIQTKTVRWQRVLLIYNMSKICISSTPIRHQKKQTPEETSTRLEKVCLHGGMQGYIDLPFFGVHATESKI